MAREAINLPKKCTGRTRHGSPKANVVVAEVTVPSLGVGYELAFAEKLRKPCLVIYDSELNNNISSMITGDDYFRCRCYKGETQAIQTIDEFLTEFTEDK